MERRETYDPEDIESLLSERAFDELLEEERAFVLRHLSGRVEYEAMRALLHQVRRDEHADAGLELDEAVKEHVMAAYRAHRRPQWGFSLNSVLAFLWPAQPAQLWRPALALGGLTAAVVLSVLLWQRSAGPANQLAEVRPEKAAPIEQETAQVRDGDAPATSGKLMEDIVPEEQAFASTIPSTPALAERKVEVNKSEVAELDAVADEVKYMDVAPAAAAWENEKEKALAFDTMALPQAGATRTVPQAELHSNMSLTNATLESTTVAKSASSKKKQRSADAYSAVVASRSLAETPQLKELLAAAW